MLGFQVPQMLTDRTPALGQFRHGGTLKQLFINAGRTPGMS